MPDIKTSVMSIAIALASCASGIAICPVLAESLLPVVQQLDLRRYVGQWYEIARYPACAICGRQKDRRCNWGERRHIVRRPQHRLARAQ